MTAIMAKTICVQCKHYCGPGKLHPWHRHRCTHPDFEKQQEQDPVTGDIGFAGRNDLGRVAIDDERYPYCRDINHGNCEKFDAKPERWGD